MYIIVLPFMVSYYICFIDFLKSKQSVMKQVSILLIFAFMSVFVACKQGGGAEKAKTSDAAATSALAGATLNVNTNSSIINWTGSKIGGSHSGTIQISNGNLAIKNGNITGGSFVIDMNSILNTDLPDAKKGDLVGHLKNSDFFDVAVFPTAKFDITNITALKNEPGASHLVYGNLTLKDVTKEIGFKANINVAGNNATVKTVKFAIDRADFNVKYGSNRFFDNLKDKAINDNIDLEIVVNAS